MHCKVRYCTIVHYIVNPSDMERFFSSASVILLLLCYAKSKRIRVNNDLAYVINAKSESNPPLHPNVTYLNISMYVRNMYAVSEKEMTFRMAVLYSIKLSPLE